jgi:NADPH-dependent ferric siderophore reductase
MMPSSSERRPTQAAAPQAPPRRRRPPTVAEVVAVRHVAPKVVSITFAGEGLEPFARAAPTAHLKLFMPAPGERSTVLPVAGPEGLLWPGDQPRPTVRTYTPRRFDGQIARLEVWVVLHGHGPGAAWASRVEVGHSVGVGGPGGRFVLDTSARQWWIAGDESALPAVATLLDALGPDVQADVHLEVAGPDFEPLMPARHGVRIHWHRRTTTDRWGQRLDEAASAARLSAETCVWVACEAGAVRRLRHHFLATADPALAPSALTTRGYWREGTENHPDHDYGEDAT